MVIIMVVALVRAMLCVDLRIGGHRDCAQGSAIKQMILANKACCRGGRVVKVQWDLPAQVRILSTTKLFLNLAD